MSILGNIAALTRLRWFALAAALLAADCARGQSEVHVPQDLEDWRGSL